MVVGVNIATCAEGLASARNAVAPTVFNGVLGQFRSAIVFLKVSWCILMWHEGSGGLASLACCLVLICAGCSARRNVSPRIAQIAAAEKISVPGIKDFGKVNDNLYRGGQPKDDSLAQLKKLGVNTIVDLRGVLHGAVDNERNQAQSLGIQFVNLPGNGWSNPTDDQIAQFFSLVLKMPRRTIFIHCWLGGDRSGMFIAAYRIAFDGWTAQQAVDEMREFHYLEFWHPGMKRYVEEFPERLARSPELAPFRQIPRHDD